MLCKKCDNVVLSNLENTFKSEVFDPFVSTVIRPDGMPKLSLTDLNIRYGEWLLRFILSLQWRVSFLYLKEHPRPETEGFRGPLQIWGDYIAGRSNDPGPFTSYMFFLYNIDGVELVGDRVPIPENQTHYLMRTTDGALFFQDQEGNVMLSVYTKLGPIAFWTSIEPRRMENVDSCRVKPRGFMPFKQILGDPRITDVIYRAQPLDNQRYMKISPRQEKRVLEAYQRKGASVLTTPGFQASKSDFLRRLHDKKIPPK